MRRHTLLPLIALLFAWAPAAAQTVLYVHGPQTPGANTGTSWPDAFRGAGALQRALDAAAPISNGGQTVQLWVAAGVYVPTLRTHPTVPNSGTFRLFRNLELYGGFTGTELSLNERDPETN